MSTYQPVVWVESDGEECNTVFVKKCEDKSENVCADVTETKCKVSWRRWSHVADTYLGSSQGWRTQMFTKECTALSWEECKQAQKKTFSNFLPKSLIEFFCIFVNNRNGEAHVKFCLKTFFRNFISNNHVSSNHIAAYSTDLVWSG